MFHSLNHQCTNFHQISRLCLPQQYLELIRFWRISWQRFKYFLVLNFLIEKGEPLNRCYYSCISPDGQSWGWETMRVCVHLSHFYINLYISFIYEDIFTRFAENDYGCENMSAKNFVLIWKKQYGNHSQLLKNHWYVLSFKILQVALSDLHKL